MIYLDCISFLVAIINKLNKPNMTLLAVASQVMMLFQVNNATARFAMRWKKISGPTPIGVHWDASL